MQIPNEQVSSMEKPVEVTRAVQLLYASLGIGLVKSIVDFGRISSQSSVGLTLFIMLVTFGLLFFFIWKISDGRNWARIVFLVLFLLGLPFSVPLYLEEFGRNIFLGSLSVIQVLIQLIATYLMFKKSSSLWFRARKARVNAQ